MTWSFFSELKSLSRIVVTRTRRHKELTKKLTNLMANLCCARKYSVQFFVQVFFTQLNCTVYVGCLKPFKTFGALYGVETLNTPTKTESHPHDQNTETYLVSETFEFRATASKRKMSQDIFYKHIMSEEFDAEFQIRISQN
jgi:hypothetical protein